jgi:uncharacterized DUF497 family protein
MIFEYSPNKRKINKEKHGIDFKDARLLWLDIKRIEIDAQTVREIRKLLIAALKRNVWVQSLF